jgi:hypothetical protein
MEILGSWWRFGEHKTPSRNTKRRAAFEGAEFSGVAHTTKLANRQIPKIEGIRSQNRRYQRLIRVKM